MFKLHTKLVGYDAGLEDMLMKSPLKGLTTCIMVWGMRLSCITNTGILRVSMWVSMLSYGNDIGEMGDSGHVLWQPPPMLRPSQQLCRSTPGTNSP